MFPAELSTLLQNNIYEKVAQLGRISHVLGLREHKVHSNPLVSCMIL